MSEAIACWCILIALAIVGAGVYVGGKAVFGVRASFDEDATLDHVPVKEQPTVDWRLKALVEAHQKYGRPFKVGPDGMGEVLKRQRNGVLAVDPKPEIIATESRMRAVR